MDPTGLFYILQVSLKLNFIFLLLLTYSYKESTVQTLYMIFFNK